MELRVLRFWFCFVLSYFFFIFFFSSMKKRRSICCCLHLLCVNRSVPSSSAWTQQGAFHAPGPAPPEHRGARSCARGRGAPAPQHSGGSGTSSLLGARHIPHYTQGTDPNPAPAQAARVPGALLGSSTQHPSPRRGAFWGWGLLRRPQDRPPGPPHTSTDPAVRLLDLIAV